MCEALILFISLFIHWSIAPGNKQVVGLWQSWGEHFSRPGLRLVPESNLCLEWENCFICRCRPLKVTPIHACTSIETCAHTTSILVILTPMLCIHLNEEPHCNKQITDRDNFIILLPTFQYVPLRLVIYLLCCPSLILFWFICIDAVIIC